MTNIKGYIALGIAAVLLIVTGFVFGKSPKAMSFGAVGSQLIEQYDPYVLYNGGINSALPVQTSGTFTLGSAGTALSKIIAPTNCTLIASGNTITASTTKDVDCLVNGLVSGDLVFAVATTSISTTGQGVDIVASRASTTPGYATLTLSNQTGTTFTFTGTASTSIQVIGFK